MFATTVAVTRISHATRIARVSHGSAAKDVGLTDVTLAVWRVAPDILKGT